MLPTQPFKSRHYTHSLEISATCEQVWRVMADVTRWAEWAPSITRIVTLTPGSFGVGSRVRIHQPGLPPAFWRVTEWTPNQGFTWVCRIPGARVTAAHGLVATNNGCRVTLSLHYGGVLGGLLAGFTHKYNVANLPLEADGLKRRSEAMAAEGFPAAQQP